jgi:hypothetical protein
MSRRWPAIQSIELKQRRISTRLIEGVFYTLLETERFGCGSDKSNRRSFGFAQDDKANGKRN